MLAYVQKGYGGPGVYELVDLPKPEPSDDEILVKVVATAVNDWELGVLRPHWLMRPFLGLRRPRGKFRVMGCDMAGVVEAVGRNVTSFAAGDEVYGDLSGYRFGAFAEYVCVNAQHLQHKPGAVTFEEAAAIPHAAELAFQAIQSAGELRAGQKVLVNGAAGGVGTLAIQLLKPRGLEVTGVDRAAKLPLLQQLGYDHVVAWPEEDFTRSGAKYDLIIDVKTSAAPYRYLRALQPTGTYATVGGDAIFSFMLLAPMVSMATRKRLKIVMLKPNRNLGEIGKLLESGELKPLIDEVFAFRDLPRALAKLREAKQVGKLVVRVP